MSSKYTNLIADIRDVTMQLSEMPEHEFVSFSNQMLRLFNDPINPSILMAQANSGDAVAQKVTLIAAVLSGAAANFVYQAQTTKPAPTSQKQLPLLN